MSDIITININFKIFYLMKRIITLMSILSICVCVVCCSETDSFTKLEESSSESEMTLFNNPYDYIGQIHNMAMDSIILNRVPQSSVKEFLYVLMDRHKDMLFQNDEFWGREYFLCLAEQIDQSGYNHSSGELTRGQINTQIDSLSLFFPISNRVYLHRLVNLVDSHFNDTTIVNLYFSQFDFDVYYSTNMSRTEKELLLSISSIAKVSYKYNLEDYCDKIIRLGIEAGIEEASDWDLEPEDIDYFSINRWDILEADVSGAIGGGIEFVLSGGLGASTVFGPGGVVIGAATSVAGGAFIGSGMAIAGAVGGALWDYFH